MIVNKRASFTLIELMVAMVVAAILAAALLVALYGAQQEARETRTRSQIAKLNIILARHWETYTSRNVAIQYSNTFLNATPREKALARLLGLRDLMRMEMPDRITDLIAGYPNNPTPKGITVVPWANNRQTALRNEPHLWRAYIRRIVSTLGAGNLNRWSPEYQSAECLYLIVATLRDEESSGLDFFRDAEIGDIDNDFMPELHDGWGRPIMFLRWAPGFPSAIQHTGLHPVTGAPVPDRSKQPDHLDLLKVDPAWNLDPTNLNIPPTWQARATDIPAPGYLLFPLIFSAGADGEYWVYTDYPNAPSQLYDYTVTNTAVMRMVLDPYDSIGTDANGNRLFIGSPQPPENPIPPAIVGEQYHMDNIHNHLIEVR